MSHSEKGFSGYNSEEARLMLPHILEAEMSGKSQVKLMTIFFGTNDGLNTFQGVPLGRYIENTKYMVEFAREKGVENVIIIGPALHDTPTFLNQNKDQGVGPVTSNSIYRKTNDHLTKLCKDLNVPFIDTWKVFQAASGYTELELLDEQYPNLLEFLFDGIHFSPSGYQLLFDEVCRVIDKWYPDFAADKLEMKFPNFTDVDMENLSESLFANVRLQ
ncbi:isoamyl acetate-hydrolyzing esterase [Yamadazyma tenuis]|uniref:isoamyl acetate-hydrolyzing esterase n=1 Tax=Candida tenuis TaxID=2315449 RepID=UPI0027AAAD4E|nr:isoamyl acetate-hydrolyzing esterase [Yamadazyma tenuis]